MENLNLAKILKDCPKGTKLYSPIFGEVEFLGINDGVIYQIKLRDIEHDVVEFTRYGKYINCEYGECMLFPSKDCRDWSQFVPPMPEPEPKPKPAHVFKPFDRVLVRDPVDGFWDIDLYGFFDKHSGYHRCMAHSGRTCIPYEGNEALLGTNDEPKDD